MLLNLKVIKIVEDGYALWNFEKNTSSLEEKIMELSQSDQYTVTLGILANYVGMPPDSIREEAYRLGKKYKVMIIENNN